MGVAFLCIVAGVLAASGIWDRPNLFRDVLAMPTEEVQSELICYGRVDMRNGCAELTPRCTGQVTEICVQENERVPAGTVLLRLEDSLAQSRLVETEANLEAAQVALEEADQQARQHQWRIRTQQAAVEAARQRLAAARETLTKDRDLREKNLIGEADVAITAARVDELVALQSVESNRQAELESQRPELLVRKCKAGIKQLQEQLIQARKNVEDHRLTAPRDGVVIRILARCGEMLSPSPGRAVLFACDEPKIIRAEVEQRFASRVHVGQAVRIQDRHDVASIGSGTITAISEWYLPQRLIFLEPTRSNHSHTLECIITPDTAAPLRVGQQVSITFLKR